MLIFTLQPADRTSLSVCRRQRQQQQTSRDRMSRSSEGSHSRGGGSDSDLKMASSCNTSPEGGPPPLHQNRIRQVSIHPSVRPSASLHCLPANGPNCCLLRMMLMLRRYALLGESSKALPLTCTLLVTAQMFLLNLGSNQPLPEADTMWGRAPSPLDSDGCVDALRQADGGVTHRRYGGQNKQPQACCCVDSFSTRDAGI